METDWSAADAIARRVLATHEGVARIESFVSAGLTRHQIAAIFRRGVMERPRFAWYVDPVLPWRAKHAIRVGGVLDCVSAAASYGVPVPPEAARCTHVRVAANTPRLRHNRDRTWYVSPGDDAEVEVHWSRGGTVAAGWRTGLVDSLVQLAGCVSVPWFIVAMDHVLHRPRDGQPLLSPEEYTELVGRLPPVLRDALALVDPRSESPIETLLRLGLVRRGIGPFDLQVQVHPRHRVDILVRDRIVLEADGEAYHDPVADAQRDAVLVRCGYLVLRFSYDRIVNDLEAVLDEIEAALAVLQDTDRRRCPTR